MSKAPDLREIPELPDEIIQAGLNGELVLFVGAGVSAIKDYGDDAAQLYRQCIDIIGGEPEHPDFSSYMTSGWVDHKSAISKEELLSWDSDELIKQLNTYLESYTPPPTFDGPDLEGLAKTLRQVVKAEPLRFYNQLQKFSTLGIPYIHEFIEAYRELWSENAQLPWDEIWSSLLGFCRDIANQERFWSQEYIGKRSSFVPNRHWIVSGIGSLIEAGTKSDEHAFNEKLLNQAEEVILILLGKEKGEEFKIDSDAVMVAINSPRGQPVFPPVGVSDNQLDKIQRELLGHCNLIQPPYFPMLSVEVFEGRNLIVLWAPGGQNRPYKAPAAATAKHKVYQYFIRRYSSTVEARGADERELLSLTATVPFDDRYHQTANTRDLSPRLMEEFLREVGSDLAEEAKTLSTEALGRQMNVVGGPQEAPLVKNVGLLFFSEHPHQFFPATQIDVVWFPEGAGGDRFEEKIFQGPLARMTREALDYIQRNYLRETVIKHPHRAEAERFWNFPYAAIEEAVVNAVYHRSYEEREPIEVRITPDDLVVLSFPGPDRSIRMEELRAGRAVSRRYRNRRIGEFLKELDLTEGRSTGIPKILKVMQENGSPAPEFESDDGRTHLLIRFPVHTKATRLASGEVTGEVAPQDGTKSGPSRDQVLILRNLAQDRGIAELMALLERSNRTKFRDQVLNPLIDAGLIEMTIPDKPQSSKQKYRLTAAGRALLEQRARSQDGTDV